MATGIVVAGGAIASSFYSPIADFLINNVGISKTFIYIGIPALVISVFLSCFLDNPPKEFTRLISREEELLAKSKVKIDLNWREMLRTNEFYKLWVMLAFSSAGGLMIIGHISSIAKVQVDWEGGFLLVVLMSICNTIGRIFGGIVSDRIERILVLREIFILQALNMILFSLYNNVIFLGIGAGIVGLGYGAAFATFPPIVSDGYGIRNFGINYAYLTAFVLFVISILISFTFRSKEKSLDP